MCCGVGNLEVKHSNQRNIFMSTLDVADVDVMKATKTCVAATRFQYDYLNDDITDDGKIDYTLTNKIPQGLQQAIKEGKKILVLINPPYAEATSSDNVVSSGSADASKIGVAKTKLAATAIKEFGKASNDLYTQFIARVAKEIPTATLAMFSTLKYVISPTLNVFRDKWNAKYLGGFAVHSKSFDGLKGDFPIGFLVWKTNQLSDKKESITEIEVDVLDKSVKAIGAKYFYNMPDEKLLTNWIERPKSNKEDVIPLKNCITPATATKDLRGTKWSDDAIAYMWSNSNDVQQAPRTALFSSGFNGGHGIFVNKENLWQAAIVFTVRLVVKPTWLNDRDQFLQPTQPLTNEFKSDCLIWMLFNGSNLTASANELEWNGKQWSIVNHFIPFTEEEVGANERFESDFMVRYLASPYSKGGELDADKKNNKTKLEWLKSPSFGGVGEAEVVLQEGKKLWQAYFAHTDVRTVRDTLKLNRADVGWYQIRKALQARNASGDFPSVSFKRFEDAYKILTEKLQPQVYELGFLKL